MAFVGISLQSLVFKSSFSILRYLQMKWLHVWNLLPGSLVEGWVTGVVLVVDASSEVEKAYRDAAHDSTWFSRSRFFSKIFVIIKERSSLSSFYTCKLKSVFASLCSPAGGSAAEAQTGFHSPPAPSGVRRTHPYVHVSFRSPV